MPPHSCGGSELRSAAARSSGAWAIDEQWAPGQARLLLARRARQHDVALGGRERAALRAHGRRGSARARCSFAELRDVFHGERRTRRRAAARTDERILVQRRVRRLSPELQLGHGRDPRARAPTARPPARLDLGRAVRRVRTPQGQLPDFRSEEQRGAAAQLSPPERRRGTHARKLEAISTLRVL